MEKCSICHKEIKLASGHTESQKPLCDCCVVQYKIAQTLPDFKEYEDLTEGQLKEIRYRILDMISYEHFRRRLNHILFRKNGPVTTVLGLVFLSMFPAAMFSSLEVNLVLSFVLGLSVVFLILLAIKLMQFRRFKSFQSQFLYKLSVSGKTGEISGLLTLGSEESFKVVSARMEKNMLDNLNAKRRKVQESK